MYYKYGEKKKNKEVYSYSTLQENFSKILFLKYLKYPCSIRIISG